MKYFTIWYMADEQTYMVNWSASSKEEAINDFWEWALDEYSVVCVDCVEESP